MSDVTVYTTPTCPWCYKVKTFLDEQGIGYNEVNVADDYEAAQKMVDLTGQRSVPVITRGERYVVGFDPERLENMLNR